MLSFSLHGRIIFVQQNKNALKTLVVKKHLNLTIAVRLLLFVDVLLCVIAALTVTMVNGADGFTLDHVCLLVLVGITVLTAFLVKKPGFLHNKALVWIALAPLAFVSYQTVVSSLLAQHA